VSARLRLPLFTPNWHGGRIHEEHPRKVVSALQKYWEDRVPIFLLAYRTSTHETTGMTPTSMVFRKDLHLPCDLFFGTSRDKEQSTPEFVSYLVKQMHDIHYIAHQHLKVASDKMKACYDCLAHSPGFQEGHQAGCIS
jgi:hypothetical protein